jgi:hypothetical protein
MLENLFKRSDTAEVRVLPTIPDNTFAVHKDNIISAVPNNSITVRIEDITPAVSDNTFKVVDMSSASGIAILRPKNMNLSINLKGRPIEVFDKEDYTTISYTLLYLLVIYVVVSALYIVYKMLFATSNNISNK